MFLDSDWYTTDNCPLIDDYILEDTGNFAGFMYQLIVNLIGGEDKILEYIGVPKTMINKFDGHFLDDEEFDE